MYRVAEYIENDGTVKAWPKYDLENKKYLIFGDEKTEEGQGLWTENKRFINEVLQGIGGGKNTPPHLIAPLYV